MHNIRLTELADADLIGIYIYTHNSWGEPQAIKYTNALKAAFDKIAENPIRIGTVDRSEVRPGYRSYHQQRHLIFYRVVGNTVEIVRLLHDSMNVTQHFPEDG